MSFVGKQVERVTVHDSVYVIYLPLCQWFLSLLAEKLPQKGNLWQPDSPKFFVLSQIKEAPKRPIFGSVLSQMSSVWKSSLGQSSVPRKEPSQGPSCTTMRPHSVAPGPSSGSVNVSGRLSPSPGGPRHQQHLGPYPGIGEWDWKHTGGKDPGCGWPQQSEQLSCQGLTLAFRQTPQNKGGT